MGNIITECAKYLMIILITIYTYQCFTVFAYEDEGAKRRIFRMQTFVTFLIHFLAFASMYMQTEEIKILLFYVAQTSMLLIIELLYTRIYSKVSRLIVNNMCLLLAVGFIILTRLDYAKAMKQCIIVAGSVAISLFVPVMIRKIRRLSEFRYIYAGIGLVSLGAVVVAGQVSYGAKLGFEIAGIGIQPSEFVKILFVFFVAASLNRANSFREIVIVTSVAAFHVLILVVSKDLGAAIIIFVVYLVMLYVSTRQPLYIAAGLGAGSVAAIGAYYLFDHVRVRVLVWQDPLGSYFDGGMQVSQSLFAIGTGSWFGTGLLKGRADAIPVASEDFVFSAISEEMGLIFALCLILVCLSCYIMFLNIAIRLKNQFYKLVALGLGTCYAFQTFINVGGVTKFIPSTGVTLPLVSYGGSSVLSTLIMFAIIQGLYILREDEEEDIERQKKRRPRVDRPGRTTANDKAKTKKKEIAQQRTR